MRQTLSVLDLLQGTITEARRGGPDLPTIVTAAVEDLDRHSRLIEEAIRHAEGVFVDVAGAADGVRAGLPLAELERVVTASLTHPGVLTISRRGDRVIPQLDGRISEDPSPALRETLGIATALFDADLQGHSLVAVTYRETNLDPYAADEAWSFFTRQLRGVPLGTVTSLIILVNTPRVRYSRFCTASPSLRFRLAGGRLSERHPWSVDEANIRQLRIQAQDRGLVVFLGAGFSQPSGLPFGVELRDVATRALLRVDEDNAEELAGLLFDRLDSQGRLTAEERRLTKGEFAEVLTLERVLQEELATVSPAESPTLKHVSDRDAEACRAPAQGPRGLHELINSGAKVIVVTVNFDHLAESGLREAVVYASDEEFVEARQHIADYLAGRDPRTPVLKLHGTIDRQETVIATINEIAHGLSAEKRGTLLALAEHDLPWVYIGYSFRDPDVLGVLQMAEFQDGEEWWVAPFPVPSAEQFVREHRPGHDPRRGMSITQGADAFLALLGGL